MRRAVEMRLVHKHRVLNAPFRRLGDRYQWKRVVGVTRLMSAEHGAIAGTDGGLKNLAEDGL